MQLCKAKYVNHYNPFCSKFRCSICKKLRWSSNISQMFHILSSGIKTGFSMVWYCIRHFSDWSKNINWNLNSQKTPHIFPLCVSYGASFGRFMVKINHFITALHCIWTYILYRFSDSMHPKIKFNVWQICNIQYIPLYTWFGCQKLGKIFTDLT